MAVRAAVEQLNGRVLEQTIKDIKEKEILDDKSDEISDSVEGNLTDALDTTEEHHQSELEVFYIKIAELEHKLAQLENNTTHSVVAVTKPTVKKRAVVKKPPVANKGSSPDVVAIKNEKVRVSLDLIAKARESVMVNRKAYKVKEG